MKTIVYFGIMFRLFLLCSAGMLLAYIAPFLHTFFNDKLVTTKEERWDTSFFDRDWIWSSMHYWYFIFTALLFILSLINVIISITNLINKHYNIFK